MQEITEELLRHVKSSDKSSIKNILESELEDMIEGLTHIPFIVHVFKLDNHNSKLPLVNLIKMCKDKPILFLGKDKDGAVAKAVTPEQFVDEGFDASKWMTGVAKAVGSTCVPPRGQDPKLVCNMKAKKGGRAGGKGFHEDMAEEKSLK